MQNEDRIYHEVTECRICANYLESVLDLGSIFPSDFSVSGKGSIKIPLELMVCPVCRAVQLRHTVDRDIMYRQYWYRSGLNNSMKDNLRELSDSVKDRHSPIEGEIFTIIDIGCNDGTFLDFFGEEYWRIGFDPARNITPNIDEYHNEYFDGCETRADIITSIAMFYDVDDPHAFIKRIKESMFDDGMWVVQMTDLKSMLQLNAFDNIVHEHILYYSLDSFIALVEMHDLEVFDVEYNNVNGGSMRVYVANKGFWPVSPSVIAAITEENTYFFSDSFDKFANRVEKNKRHLHEILDGKSVSILGGSTKGNTLLQYYGLTKDDIDRVAEVNPEKFGLKTVGSGIPICSDEEAFLRNPDYMLVLPWHFIDDFLIKYKSFIDNGGALVTPLPEPRVYK